MTIEPLADCPDLLALHAHDTDRYPFLLESTAEGGPGHARWDILFAFPGARIWRDAAGVVHGGGAGGFLDALDDAWRAERDGDDAHPSGLPFRGGWFLFCGYELAAEIEPKLRLPHDASTALPVAFAVRIPVALVHDRHHARTWLIAERGQDALLEALREDIATTAPTPTARAGDLVRDLEEAEPAAYIQAVERVRRYIHDGDVYQVNLAREWQGRLAPGRPAHDAYMPLRAANPAPFSGIARWHDAVSIISASPERLVRTTGRRVETRPIAGTRPRGAGLDEDRALSSELLAHPKERAEHVMLIDLERNDLGRVCVPGTVAVDEMMVIESYASVHHIVSNVCGELRPGTTPGQVIAAVFPGGTITGCPKLRCMEIIAELEAVPRGAYTGSFGYLNRNGDLDMNILIRTIVVEGDRVSLRAGAGIVADSEPLRELEETRDKARGMWRALDVAGTCTGG